MFDRLEERFCEFDDFCKAIRGQWEAMLLTDGTKPARRHGPEGGLCESEIMTSLVLYHSSRFKNFKTFYNGIVLGLMKPYFPKAPCYERFIALTGRVPALFDKALLNGRNIAETIIGHIKEFSSLRSPKHRSVFNAFTHLTAAIIAYQIDPLPPRSVRLILPS